MRRRSRLALADSLLPLSPRRGSRTAWSLLSQEAVSPGPLAGSRRWQRGLRERLLIAASQSVLDHRHHDARLFVQQRPCHAAQPTGPVGLLASGPLVLAPTPGRSGCAPANALSEAIAPACGFTPPITGPDASVRRRRLPRCPGQALRHACPTDLATAEAADRLDYPSRSSASRAAPATPASGSPTKRSRQGRLSLRPSSDSA